MADTKLETPKELQYVEENGDVVYVIKFNNLKKFADRWLDVKGEYMNLCPQRSEIFSVNSGHFQLFIYPGQTETKDSMSVNLYNRGHCKFVVSCTLTIGNAEFDYTDKVLSPEPDAFGCLGIGDISIPHGKIIGNDISCRFTKVWNLTDDLIYLLKSTKQDAHNNNNTAKPRCPTCFEEMSSKTKIAQCISGHLLCWQCREKLGDRNCSSCDQPVNGRAFGMENYLRSIFG